MFKQFSDSTTNTIEVVLNGQAIQVTQGISVAAMILAQGLRFNRTTPVSNSKYAPFCMMGVCYDCLMVIDGKPNQRACSIRVKQGMKIDTQQGVGPALRTSVGG
ncbi:MAG TPA: (2Fe-2S)-binding protein [Crenotrichaceae bacterium]|nr:(2Fe-2S)-binding protein [Crenotrichaceae bacterium]